MSQIIRHPSPGLEGCPFFDGGAEPSALAAWELDASFRAVHRAVPVADLQPAAEDLSLVRQGAKLPLFHSPHEEPSSSSVSPFSSPCSSSLPPSSPCNSSSALHCPLRPCHLMRTHVKLTLSEDWSLPQLISAISRTLDNFTDFDFSFDPAAFLWRGKYLRGSASCSVLLQLFAEPAQPEAFWLQAVRLEGEARPFHDFFREFKHLLGTPSSEKTDSNPLGEEVLGAAPPQAFEGDGEGDCLSPTNFLRSIEPLLKMACSPFFEARLEAARMLCDLSLHDAALLATPAVLGAVLAALQGLVRDYFPAVREQAIVALGAFSEVPGFGPRLADAEALSALLALAENPPPDQPPCESAQLRREAARIVAAAAASDPKRCVATLTAQGFPLGAWLDRVAGLRDGRLKKLAQRVADALQRAL